MNKEKFYLFLIIFIAAGITFSQVILASWVEPGQSVEGNENVDAPVNVSVNAQIIHGALVVAAENHADRYGLVVKNEVYPDKGVTWAQGGVQIEQRTSDPAGSPGNPKELVDGRIWLRTTLH